MGFTPGWNLAEAQLLVTLCCYAYSAADTASPSSEPADHPPPAPTWPANWVRKAPNFTDPIGENLAYVAQNSQSPNQYALIFRGTDNLPNVVEDVDLIMGPATNFSNQPDAQVHKGFALALTTLLPQIEAYFGALPGAQLELYVTGHSLGAAMATLFNAYLGSSVLSAIADRKTYTFACPKPGNARFAYDYDRRFSNFALSYRVANDYDWVPESPLTIELPEDTDIPSGALPHVIQDVDHLLSDVFKHSLNFSPAGLPYVLSGSPTPPGTTDLMYQHHCTLYAKLLGAT
jgi:hypothetical protein